MSTKKLGQGKMFKIELSATLYLWIRINKARHCCTDNDMFTKKFGIWPPGALYPDGTSGQLKDDDAIPTRGNFTYRWEVRPEYAPTDADANCLTWVYHSHVDAPRDIASGLIGALLTCKKGTICGHVMWCMLFTITDSSLDDTVEECSMFFSLTHDGKYLSVLCPHFCPLRFTGSCQLLMLTMTKAQLGKYFS